jgi:hypothetical protein
VGLEPTTNAYGRALFYICNILVLSDL